MPPNPEMSQMPTESEIEAEAHITTAEEDAQFGRLMPHISEDRAFETNDGRAIAESEALEFLARAETHQDFAVLALTDTGLKPLGAVDKNDTLRGVVMENKKLPGQQVPLALSEGALFTLQGMVSAGLNPVSPDSLPKYRDMIKPATKEI